RAVVQKLEEHIKNGNPMSVAMADFHESFPNYYISLIKAGESSGKLDDVFLRLADNLEKAKEYKSKVTGALIYPAVIVIGILVVAFIMMTFVLPKLLDLYKNFNVTLPFTTQMVIGLSNFMQNYWIIVLIFVFLSIGVVRFLLNNPQNQRALDYYMLKVPVFGGIIQKSVLVESTRTLSILITSGVPILEAINIVKSTTSNMLYREAYESVYSDIEKGRNLGDALSETDLFPTIFVQMASVGERTGKLDDTLMRLSIYFQMESEIAIKTAMTLIEPLILVVLGVGVGFLVLSVLTPIYNLTSSFGAGQ
ncbi:MAG: type II secretion system F family protein, partial [Patescibacteria group bacterium]